MRDSHILVVDDHALFRTGLRMILTELGEAQEVYEAGSILEALNLADKPVDLILLDIQMPGLNGLEGSKVLKEKFIDIPIIILSASHEINDVFEAQQVGAKGYLQKTAPAGDIVTAITSVLNGDECFPVGQSVNDIKSEEKKSEELTPRQLEVLALLCEGKPNKVIARELDLSENTVRVHVSAILSILDVSSRSEAMIVAQKQKLISVKHMRLLPRFREERILREEVALIYQNYNVGIVGYYLATIIATSILHQVSNAVGILYWLIAATIGVSAVLLRYWFIKNKQTVPKTEAIAQVCSLFLLGIIWSALPLLFFDGNNTIVMVAITGITAGVAAAALAMTSSCLPVFLAYAYTSLPALSLGFFLLEDTAYNGMGAAVILYLAVLTYFAINFEKMIKHSIELRFKNVDLIEQLQDAIAETEEANRAKSVFLASASHDLRQPLHAMGLFIQTLNGTKLDAYQKSIISYIESASKATREMLNTLLDFSKLDAGVIKPKPRAFRLQKLFNKLEQELAASADSKRIVYRTRETTVAAYADLALIELILRNLISNAIRYTEEGGVLIACRQKGNRILVIEVWDTGIGIPEEEQENIFKEFHQLDNPERDRQKGFGLGLAIAKGLVNTMGLVLTVKSVPGSGSVFRLQVPEAEISVVEDIPDNQEVIRFDGKCVLLVDDDESVRLAMRELLLSWGCDCLIAESADEALINIKDKTPDLLIVDYRLREGRTGGEAISLLRQKVNTELPAIIITGDTAADRLREAQASDALLLHKPVATTELQQTMYSLLYD